MTDYSNRKTNKLGDVGERWFELWCSDNDYIAINVGKDEFIGFESKIDFIVKHITSDKVSRWEVKTDNSLSKTGNMFVETSDDKAAKSLGWYYTSKAQNICYIDYNNRIMYMFTFSSLRSYVEEHQVREACCYDRTKTRVGKLVKMSNFEKYIEDNKGKLFKIDVDEKYLIDTADMIANL